MTTAIIEQGLELAVKLRPHYVHVTRQLFPVPLVGSGGITGDRLLRLYFDPDAIESWELDWVTSRILVIVEHYFRRHPERQQGRDQLTWDVATEIAVTDALSRENFRFPPDTLFPERFKLPEMLSAEEYQVALFRMCRRRRKQIEEQMAAAAGLEELPTFGSAASEQLKEWEEPEDANLPTVDYLVALMMQRDMQSEESTPGEGAGDEDRQVNETQEATIDWRPQCRGLLGSIISTLPGMSDYSFLVPDPDVALNMGLIMPGMVGRKANIAVIIDSSSSMGESRLAHAIAETGGILRSLEGESSVWVYSVDTAVHSVREVFHQQQISLIGNGGTDMRIGIRAAVSRFPGPDIVIVITDGDTPWPDKAPPGIRFIVVLVGNGTVPEWVTKVFRVEIRH